MTHRNHCHMCCDRKRQLKTYWQFSLKTFLGLHHIIFLFNYWKFEKILKSNTLVHIFFQIFHISRQFSSIGGWEVRTPDSGSGAPGSIPHRTKYFFGLFALLDTWDWKDIFYMLFRNFFKEIYQKINEEKNEEKRMSW